VLVHSGRVEKGQLKVRQIALRLVRITPREAHIRRNHWRPHHPARGAAPECSAITPRRKGLAGRARTGCARMSSHPEADEVGAEGKVEAGGNIANDVVLQNSTVDAVVNEFDEALR